MSGANNIPKRFEKGEPVLASDFTDMAAGLSRLSKLMGGDMVGNGAGDFQRPLPPNREIHIARVPADGIPGLIETGSGDLAGSATCDVYKLDDDGILESVGIDKVVYNLSPFRIAQGWILIARNKFGSWVATQPGTLDDDGTGDGSNPLGDLPCFGIPGVSAADIPVVTDPEYVLGFKNGCLVLVEVSPCAEAGTGTADGTAGTGGGGGDACCDTGVTMALTVSGVVNNLCSFCGDFNQGWTSTGSILPCDNALFPAVPGSGCDGSVALTIVYTGGITTLEFKSGSVVYATYTYAGCPNVSFTANLISNGTECTNWPATIDVTVS